MKKLFPFILLFWASDLLSQTRFLIPFRVGNLWGYADTNRQIVISPKYDEANVFMYGYASVRVEQYYGLLKGDGTELIKPAYESVTERYGDYLVVTRDGKKGIIDLKTGKFILQLKYRYIEKLDDLNLIVTDSRYKKGLWNIATNRWVLPQQYNHIARFATHSFILGATQKTIGIFNVTQKKWLLAPQYDDISFDPYSGIHNYWVARKNNKNTRFNVTPKGQIIIAKNYKEKQIVPAGQDTMQEVERIEEIIEDTTFSTQTVPVDEHQVNFASGQDKKPLPNLFEAIIETDSSESYNLYIVKLNGKYGLANRENELMLPCRYDTIIPSWNGVPGYILMLNNMQGAYLYSKSKSLNHVLIEARYDYTMGVYASQPANYNPRLKQSLEFNDGIFFFIYVSKNGKRGYVDLKGNEFFKD